MLVQESPKQDVFLASECNACAMQSHGAGLASMCSAPYRQMFVQTGAELLSCVQMLKVLSNAAYMACCCSMPVLISQQGQFA